MNLWQMKVAPCRFGRMASSDEVVYRAGPMTSSPSSFSLGVEASNDSKERIINGVQPIKLCYLHYLNNVKEPRLGQNKDSPVGWLVRLAGDFFSDLTCL